VHQALYTHKLLHPLRIKTAKPTPIFNNNQGELKILQLMASPYHGHMKHYEIKVAHLHNSAKNELISYHYCATNDMPANVLTKPLGRIKFIEMRNCLGLHLPPSSKGHVKIDAHVSTRL
jgi:hypothetical protein